MTITAERKDGYNFSKWLSYDDKLGCYGTPRFSNFGSVITIILTATNIGNESVSQEFDITVGLGPWKIFKLVSIIISAILSVIGYRKYRAPVDELINKKDYQYNRE